MCTMLNQTICIQCSGDNVKYIFAPLCTTWPLLLVQRDSMGISTDNSHNCWSEMSDIIFVYDSFFYMHKSSRVTFFKPDVTMTQWAASRAYGVWMKYRDKKGKEKYLEVGKPEQPCAAIESIFTSKCQKSYSWSSSSTRLLPPCQASFLLQFPF